MAPETRTTIITQAFNTTFWTLVDKAGSLLNEYLDLSRINRQFNIGYFSERYFTRYPGVLVFVSPPP